MKKHTAKNRTIAEIKHSFVHSNVSKTQALKRLKYLTNEDITLLVTDYNKYGSRRQLITGWQAERIAKRKAAVA